MPHEVVIDVGAGMWKTYEQKLDVNKNLIIMAFEPCKTLVQKIREEKETFNASNKSRLLIYDCAISDYTGKGTFYIVNDPVASSLSSLNSAGIAKWRYPFGRKKFSIRKKEIINVYCLTEFINTCVPPNVKKGSIELLNINIQGNCLKVLEGISNNLLRKIKRVIVKCIDIPFNLYVDQTDIVDIIDKLRVHDFTLIRGEPYSRNQEQIIEFVNLYFRPTQKQLTPWFRITETGELIVNFK